MCADAPAQRLSAHTCKREGGVQSSNSGLHEDLRIQGKQLEDEQVSTCRCITHSPDDAAQWAMPCVMHGAVTQAAAHACTGNSPVFAWLCMTKPSLSAIHTFSLAAEPGNAISVHIPASQSCGDGCAGKCEGDQAGCCRGWGHLAVGAGAAGCC